MKNTGATEKVWQHVNGNADIHGYRAEYATAMYKQYARDIKDIPYDDSIDLSEIAKTQDNKSVADIVAFFEKACRFSAENKYDILTEECFQKAMDTETKKDECRRIGFL